MGTLPYMAPEQIEGRPADARTDIFALGAVLYEMTTGRRPFSGESQASLITAIMSAEPPPVSTSRDGCPPSLDRVVKKCLAKDPDGRWQDAGDLAAELQWVGEQADVASPPAASRRGSTAAWALAVGTRQPAPPPCGMGAQAGRGSAIKQHGARHHRARTGSSVREFLTSRPGDFA